MEFEMDTVSFFFQFCLGCPCWIPVLADSEQAPVLSWRLDGFLRRFYDVRVHGGLHLDAHKATRGALRDRE
jgi:hypothetical protein